MSSLDSVPADVVAAQLGELYARFEPTERARHVELLQAVRRPEDVALHAAPHDDRRWTVTVCTSDCVGALSAIAGLFTAYRFDILCADIFTVRFATPRPPGAGSPRPRWPQPPRSRSTAPPAPSRKILDIFDVWALAEATPETWQLFREDLAALVALLVAGRREEAQDRVIERVSAIFSDIDSTRGKLLPMSIEVANDPSSPYSQLAVCSVDTPGFLFAFTNALAGLTVNVERAAVRTVNGQACDTFWVTDVAGGKITSQDRIHELQVATALVKQFTHLLPRSADPGQALRQFNGLIYQMLSRPQWTEELHNLESMAVLETLADLMGVSRFLWEDFLRLQHENLFPVLLDAPALKARRSKEHLRDDLTRRLAALGTHDERVDELNRFKDREMFRIDLRHVTGRVDFDRFSRELSTLGEVVIAAAAELAHQRLRPTHGVPTVAAGRPCPWSICALGKFGGSELGVGSDLELLFVYADEGTTDGPTPILSSQYFGHFVQAFKGVIRARQEGIFEIDLRLRPYGRAGPLASTLEGFAQYYAEHGAAEQFERMALVKLRPVAGDDALGARVVRARDAFVYAARPLDAENVRHLRQRQASELVPLGRVSAKYSHGGLVDVEYFVQARQIAAGHADASVRVTNTLDAIARLRESQHVGDQLAEHLRETYLFLRRLIDALRVVRGHAKDLTIPHAHSREFAYLAHRLRYSAPTMLEDAIAARMAFARSLWEHEGMQQ